ncbi:MAG: class I SAM-dependent methyltransferase [Bacteroidales bacterium]|nr:class I SAM-dependent methyltransferase [Bacteroidales bacterium]
MKKVIDKDAYGKGLLAWMEGRKNAKFVVASDIAETERWDISTFFRAYKDMPEAEQKALDEVNGRVLDLGAGAGSHALWLQENGFDVTAIDISQGAVQVMEKRGIKNVRNIDFFNLKDEKFDTIISLMNGAGIVQKLDRFPEFFSKAKSLLNENGTILLDSSNIIYLFLDDDGSALIDLNASYYGEMKYRMDFENFKGVPFDWIFIDFDTLAEKAEQSGFTAEKIYEDEHFLYLAKLTLKK